MKKSKNFSIINVEIENLRILISLYGGFFEHHSLHSSTHSHKSYEFHISIEGTSELNSDLCSISLKQSQACIIAPNVLHNFVPTTERHLGSSFCFSFERINKYTKSNLYEKVTKSFESVTHITKIDFAEHYLNDLKSILTEFYIKKTFSQIRIKTMFLLFILSLADELLPGVGENANILVPNLNKSEKDIRRVVIEDYISQNLDRELSLKSLSGILYLSEKQTERIFEQEFGMPFKKYILNVRFNEAIYYLSNTDMPMQNIASLVGYKTYNGFHQMFTARTGLSPKEYRARNQISPFDKELSDKN